MAITQISRVQVRRGLNDDLPQLAGGEFGWSVDTRQLYIGNGTLAENAPIEGVTEILTQYSDILSVVSIYTFKGLASGRTIATGIDALHPVVRSLQDKLDDYVSIKDFGATGDGVTDDTAAIQRAMDRVYGTAQDVLLTYHHRTIFMPAGQYRITGTLNVPPFTKLQGEGKQTTIITGNFVGPLMQFKDQFEQTGSDIGQVSSGLTPRAAEYHFSDLQLHHQNPLMNQSCLLVDGGTGVTFTRCVFRGMAAANSIVLYGTNQGIGVAGVHIRGTGKIPVQNVVFDQCDFQQINYGAELNGWTKAVTINDSYFSECYRHIVIGDDVTTSKFPAGVSITNNYQSYCYAESVLVSANVNDIFSSGNFISNWGVQDFQASAPIINTTGRAQYPAIVFNSAGNYSIGDTFANETINPSIPQIVDNSYNNYYILQGNAVVNGRRVDGQGTSVTLTDSTSFKSVGITNKPSYASNLTMDYTLVHSNAQRTGSLTVSNFGNVYTYNEDYTEVGTTNVTFKANVTTGDIEYVSPTNGAAAVLTYNIKYFN